MKITFQNHLAVMRNIAAECGACSMTINDNQLTFYFPMTIDYEGIAECNRQIGLASVHYPRLLLLSQQQQKTEQSGIRGTLTVCFKILSDTV